MRSFIICVIYIVLLNRRVVAADDIDYEPMREGCEWTMKSLIELPSGETKVATTHRKIEGQIEKNGKMYFRLRTWEEGAPDSSGKTALARKDGAGYYTIEDGKKDAKEQMEMPRPAEVGQKWRLSNGGNTILNTVIGFEAIVVEGKTYERCCHVQSKWFNGSLTVDHWAAPNVGTVKAEMVSANATKKTLTLQEFKPGK